MPRPAQADVVKSTYRAVTKGTIAGFYVICLLHVALGVSEVLVGLQVFGQLSDLVRNMWLVYGIILCLVGVGLMFRLTVIYGMIGVLCALQLVLGLVNIISAIMTVDAGIFRYSLIGVSIIQVLLAGFLFYYAEETAVRPMSAH